MTVCSEDTLLFHLLLSNGWMHSIFENKTPLFLNNFFQSDFSKNKSFLNLFVNLSQSETLSQPHFKLSANNFILYHLALLFHSFIIQTNNWINNNDTRHDDGGIQMENTCQTWTVPSMSTRWWQTRQSNQYKWRMVNDEWGGRPEERVVFNRGRGSGTLERLLEACWMQTTGGDGRLQTDMGGYKKTWEATERHWMLKNDVRGYIFIWEATEWTWRLQNEVGDYILTWEAEGCGSL